MQIYIPNESHVILALTGQSGKTDEYQNAALVPAGMGRKFRTRSEPQRLHTGYDHVTMCTDRDARV